MKFKLDYIPKRYYKFAKLQSLDSKRLIKYILQDYKIDLKLRITPKFFLIYKLMKTGSLTLREFVKENLKKGLILITVDLRNSKQNRQCKDLFKNRFEIGISSD